MATFRINKNQNYTVMSNHHFKDKRLSLKAKGLLSLMLSLPDNWDYSIRGLTALSKDGVDATNKGLQELEKYGYLKRTQNRDSKGRMQDIIYDVFEIPQSIENNGFQPCTENPHTVKSDTGKHAQLSTKELSTKELSTKCVAKQSHTRNNKLTDNDIKELNEQYGTELVNYYIDRTKNYKNCMNRKTITTWIKEDKAKVTSINKPGKAKDNKFNDFEQRNYSKEQINDIELKMLGLK